MSEMEAELLMKVTLEGVTLREVGVTPRGERRFAVIGGGRFEGPDMRGTVMPGGSDWMTGRGDGSAAMNGRLTLRTDDGHVIGMRYRGAIDGEPVGESEYRLRFVTFFEAAMYKYGWLNRLVAVGVGRRGEAGPVYDVYRVL